ncbi:hypothetical protein I552_1140 [Mycobacterium xenopi 3993]|nr:hypothetical protein I552_1140 [Mycobacterium xenopi 3993]
MTPDDDVVGDDYDDYVEYTIARGPEPSGEPFTARRTSATTTQLTPSRSTRGPRIFGRHQPKQGTATRSDASRNWRTSRLDSPTTDFMLTTSNGSAAGRICAAVSESPRRFGCRARASGWRSCSRRFVERHVVSQVRAPSAS